MRGINRVFLMGYLGSNPELLVSKSGKDYTRISLAVNRRQRSENGDYEDKTDWHRVMVWGRTAHLCCGHLKKGSPVAVEGMLTLMKAPDPIRGGQTTHTLVTADAVHFLPSRDRNSPEQPDLTGQAPLCRD